MGLVLGYLHNTIFFVLVSEKTGVWYIRATAFPCLKDSYFFCLGDYPLKHGLSISFLSSEAIVIILYIHTRAAYYIIDTDTYMRRGI